MSAYDDAELAAIRREMAESRAAIREREWARPVRELVNEILGDKQRRTIEAQEAGEARWGAPPTGGLSRSTPRLPRNSRIVTAPPRNTSYR
jgi:hypothetical protein